MAEKFAVRRKDGRSNAQVVIDLVKTKRPGDVVSYDEFATALQVGVADTFDRPKVQQVVNQAIVRALRATERTVINVRGVGYRIALAREHTRVAETREERAHRQRLKGLRVLQHVKWDEMSENERKAHEGHLLITVSICQQIDALERRQRRSEELIAKLLSDKNQAG